MADQPDNANIQQEMAPVIHELQKQGVDFNSKEDEITGLGDMVEATLQKFGVTEERFQAWFNLEGCNCQARKKWLNNLFSWHRDKK